MNLDELECLLAEYEPCDKEHNCLGWVCRYHRLDRDEQVVFDEAPRLLALARAGEKLEKFIRDSCHIHGDGDDACSCEWLDGVLQEARGGE